MANLPNIGTIIKEQQFQNKYGPFITACTISMIGSLIIGGCLLTFCGAFLIVGPYIAPHIGFSSRLIENLSLITAIVGYSIPIISMLINGIFMSVLFLVSYCSNKFSQEKKKRDECWDNINEGEKGFLKEI